jgi:hypothetical protein
LALGDGTVIPLTEASVATETTSLSSLKAIFE